MDGDLKRQIVNVVAYVATVVANGAAVALPLNGNSTAELSDRFPVLITPANYVFSIWTIIYILLGAFTVYQALPRVRQDADLRAIGYLPAVAGALNTLWIVCWHYELFALTVPIMLALLGSLILIHLGLRGARTAGGAKRWLVALPFSIYLGWITVATIANISQMLYWAGFTGGPLSQETRALIVLAIGVAVAALMLWREADWAYALVIVWAYLGIAAKQSVPAAVWGALVGAVVVSLLIVYILVLKPRTGTPAAAPST
jgi:cell division protein FtsW (lipid II flippase)